MCGGERPRIWRLKIESVTHTHRTTCVRGAAVQHHPNEGKRDSKSGLNSREWSRGARAEKKSECLKWGWKITGAINTESERVRWSCRDRSVVYRVTRKKGSWQNTGLSLAIVIDRSIVLRSGTWMRATLERLVIVKMWQWPGNDYGCQRKDILGNSVKALLLPRES